MKILKLLSKLTWQNIKSFVEGYTRQYAILFFTKNLQHIFEQVEERIEQVTLKSPECIANGQCKICGCATPALFYANKGCANNPPCYDPFLNQDDWQTLKNFKSIEPNA